jgi:hypothetical protein
VRRRPESFSVYTVPGVGLLDVDINSLARHSRASGGLRDTSNGLKSLDDVPLARVFSRQITGLK